MSSSEFLGTEFTEQLRTIQTCWLEAASQLVSARSETEVEEAQRIYVLTMLARIDWEQTGTGEVFEHEYIAERMNSLFNDGIERTLVDRRRRWDRAQVDRDYAVWQRYVETQVYPRVELLQDAELPQSNYDILMYIRSGQACWRQARNPASRQGRSARSSGR